jgi:hypothetical protein
MKQLPLYPNTRWNYIKLFGGAILLIAMLAYLATSNGAARRACKDAGNASNDTCDSYIH